MARAGTVRRNSADVLSLLIHLQVVTTTAARTAKRAFSCLATTRSAFAYTPKYASELLWQNINGIKSDGGYAEYVLLRTEAIIEVSKDADPLNVGPLFCAGVTVHNAIRNVNNLHAGEILAVQGIGGLGHLGTENMYI